MIALAMTSLVRVAVTAAAGAAAMYWLDPVAGARRRALLRDQVTSATIRLSESARVGTRDLKHRTRGVGARLRSRFSSSEIPDEVLAERVRSAMGRAVSHSGAIDVLATDGRVTLVGSVLAREHRRLLNTVLSVRGVAEVQDHLAVWERPDGVPELQGGSIRPERSAFLQENWPPAARLLAGITGTGFISLGVRELLGLQRRNALLGSALMAVGGVILARSWTNAPLKRLAGAGGRRAIDIRKTMFVRAPIEQVFSTLASYQNFPYFMRNVRNVRMHSDGRSHWEVAGPAGVSVEWDSETTVCKPNELLAWRTVANSQVAHAGIIRFEPARDGTRLDIHMTYNPPAGALGHVVAKLFGADPKKELDEDLLRLKSFLESGTRPRDAAQGQAPTPTDQQPPMH